VVRLRTIHRLRSLTPSWALELWRPICNLGYLLSQDEYVLLGYLPAGVPPRIRTFSRPSPRDIRPCGRGLWYQRETFLCVIKELHRFFRF
jgi:hypothetical protein